MMRWIIMSSIKSRILVVTLAAVLVFIGVTQLGDVPMGVYPEFSPVYVEVQTEALGLSAVEVEQLITVPLEADLLNGVAWLQEIRSESIPGLSSVVLIFEPGTDPMDARQVVQERLTQAHALPNVSKPPVMIQPLSSTSRVMKIGLSSDKLSLIEMSVLARWTIKPYLMGIQGVANVSIWGQRKRQLQVQVDPEKLQEKKVTLNQVIKTTGEALWVSPLTFLTASTPGTGGFFDTPNQRLGIRHILPISTPDELASVTVHGEKMLLRDVADVVENHQPLIGDAIINGEPGLLLVIEKFPWANTLDVTKKLDKAIENLRPGLSGIEIDSEIYRPASFIQMSVDNLSSAFIIAIVLMVLAIFFFFYSWRAALISLVAIFLSLMVAAFVLYLRGAIVDMMIFAGLVIAFGVLIDDAIISVENVMKRLSSENSEDSNISAASLVLHSILEMHTSMIFATLIVILTVLPFFFMKGITGAFLNPMAISYVLAVLASFFMALIITPALSMMLFSKSSLKHRESSLISSLRNAYTNTVSWFIKKPANAYIIFAVVVIAGIIALPFLHQDLQPPTPKERDLLIKWEGVPGTSQHEMHRITVKAMKELNAIPGVRNVISHFGRAVLSDAVVNVNSGQIWVNLTDEADYDETLVNINEVIDGYPGIDHKVQTYMEQRLNKAIIGSDNPFAVRLYGENLPLLRSKAKEIKNVLMDVNGLVDLKVELPIVEPTIEIEVDLDAAREYRIKPGDVRRAAATLLAGIVVGSLFEEQKVFEVVVWGSPKVRHSISSIRELLINTPDGGLVRLGDVADVRIASSPNVIKREGVSRYIDVSFNMQNGNFSTLQSDIYSNLKNVEFPLEFHASVVGDFTSSQKDNGRILGFVIAAVVGIFLLLQACFGSWRLAFVFFLSLLMTLAGCILALLFNGGIISLGSIVGFIAVFGIAVRNGIISIRHFQHLEQIEGLSLSPELIMRGVQERFAPILMTTITTGLVFLPILFFGNIPGLELIYSISVVIIGGLVTSTILNMFVVPEVYMRFGTVPEQILGKEEAFA